VQSQKSRASRASEEGVERPGSSSRELEEESRVFPEARDEVRESRVEGRESRAGGRRKRRRVASGEDRGQGKRSRGRWMKKEESSPVEYAPHSTGERVEQSRAGRGCGVGWRGSF
jgi:hypothetical protein